MWKGTPQDCMDHLRVAHAVPTTIKSVNLGKCFPPWTVRRQTWTDILKPSNSWTSTDVLLFICLALGPSLSGVPEGNFPCLLERGLPRQVADTQSAAMSRWGQHDDTASYLPLRTVCEVGRAECVCRRPIFAPAAVASVDREQSVVATTGA